MAALPPLVGDQTLPGSWQADAACRDAPVDIFFSLDEADQREALEYCETCPVRQECLRFAIENRETYGIWGGTREAERRTLIRDARRAQRQGRRSDAA